MGLLIGQDIIGVGGGVEICRSGEKAKMWNIMIFYEK